MQKRDGRSVEDLLRFRAWDKNQQIMRGVRGLFWTKNNLVAHCSPMGNKFDEFFTTILNDGEYHLMQSTGLFDKNDKEIFEGDIVRISMRIGKCTTTSIGAVEFDKFEVCFRIRNELGGHYVTMFHVRYFEVIGNIYQNPELVEDK